MKVLAENSDNHLWMPIKTLPTHLFSKAVWQCVNHSGSLTQYLRQITMNTIQFHLRFAEWGKANLDEYQALGINTLTPTWIREIDFCYHDQPWIFGRVIIPETSLSKKNKCLLTAGKHSIGDILFKDPTVKRGSFEYARLFSNHAYSLAVSQDLSDIPQELWARRSIFYFHDKPILVAEVFLPNFLNFLSV